MGVDRPHWWEPVGQITSDESSGSGIDRNRRRGFDPVFQRLRLVVSPPQRAGTPGAFGQMPSPQGGIVCHKTSGIDFPLQGSGNDPQFAVP